MKILLLHLSDIHFKTRTDTVLSQVQSIAATAILRIHSAATVFVVVSGDIAYSGSREQYEIASAFFRDLHSALGEETDSPVHFILAPGMVSSNGLALAVLVIKNRTTSPF